MRLLGLVLGAGLIAFASAQEGEDDAWRTEEARVAVANASNAFSLDLFGVLSGARPGNLVVCPLSAAILLALTWLGAGGETARQLQEVLHLPPDRQQVARGFKAVLASVQGELGPVDLRMANKMFVRQGERLKQPFVNEATNIFQAGIQELNFANDNENARLTINKWVQDATGGKIRELFEQGYPRREVLLLLVNAIYFKAGWRKTFDEKQTTPEQFFLMDGSSVLVPMMHGYYQLNYADVPALNARVVSLPYQGKRGLRMFVLLPYYYNGLDDMVQRLKGFNLADMDLDFADVTLKMPKFTIEDKLTLAETLQQMRVTALFSHGANLKGIADGELFVSKVVQKTFISVNENGTEASAATGVDIRLRSPFSRENFEVNHPFVCLIMSGDTILFAVKVVNPLIYRT